MTNSNHRQAAMRGAHATKDSATILSPIEPALHDATQALISHPVWKRFHSGKKILRESSSALGG
jgi:hypothetical protein